MNEYNYEIDKYLIGVDSNGEDRIGLTIATIKDNKLCILGSFYGDNARFIDLLIKQNQKYKEVIDKAIDLVEKLIKEYKLNYGDEPSKMLLAYETLLNTFKEVE